MEILKCRTELLFRSKKKEKEQPLLIAIGTSHAGMAVENDL